MNNAIQCIGKRLRAGRNHEHISRIFWAQSVNGQPTKGRESSSLQEMITYIESLGPHSVWCPDPDPRRPGAWVRVQRKAGVQFLQAVLNGRPADHLLRLPDM